MWKVYISRWVNYHLLGGKPNQMVSSRAYVEHWPRTECFINRLFFWQDNHCRQSFIWEVIFEKANQGATRKAQEKTVGYEAYPSLLEIETEGGDL